MANEKQAVYWNEVAGPKWVKIRDAMDERFVEITNLLVTTADVRPGERVLDIGCGTGPTSFQFADLTGPTGHVTGIDLSRPMLDVARQHGAETKNVTFLEADAQIHDFGSAQYDVLVSRFGVMFFNDPVAAFANLCTALVSGGRLCFVCWAPLIDNPHWQIPFKIVAEMLGYPDAKPPRSPGPMAFSEQDYVVEILRKAGFQEVKAIPIQVSIIGKSVTDEAKVACFLGPSGALMDEKKAGDETRAALCENIAKAISQFDGPNGVKLPATVFAVTARSV